jgi:superfamily II DNA or RNA helicase
VGLQGIKIKSAYYSDEDNLLQEFYVPALSSSIKYDRIAGYFSSNALAIAAKGIAAFIKAGGRIRLIANVVLSADDQEAIRAALIEKEQEVLNEIENLEDHLKKDHIRMLGWMLKNNLLEIKIAVVKGGIEHQKTGILEDASGNIISFSGSDNETVQGWLHNDEQFHVFCSWKKGDENHLKPDIERFSNLWRDEGKRVRIYDVSDAFNKGLIQSAPKNDNEFKKLSSYITKELLQENAAKYNYHKNFHEKIRLRDYQEKAIEKWEDNGCRGIFEMATGTGKTFTALGCVDSILGHEKIVVVVTAPYGHLISQWRKEISKFGLSFDDMIVADSTSRDWRNKLSDSLSDITLGHLKKYLILTTHNTFASDDFQKIVSKNKKDFKIMLIADEVHRLGAEKSRMGLLESYDFRLGLSATPKRWFDDIGTKAVYEYFNDVVFSFSLDEAINTLNPETNQTYLAPYKYFPVLIYLSEDELERYVDLTKSIVRKIGKCKNENDYSKQIEILKFLRADIIKNARAKFQALEKVLDEEKDEIKWTIIYCTTQQIDDVMRLVNSRNIVSHRFTMEESTKPDGKYGGLSEREDILDKFSKSKYKVLVAMKCLDEGVDVPQSRMGVLMASSGNPREYIQRIGRVIRNYPGKRFARIFDFVAIPPLDKLPEQLREIERSIIRKERERCMEICKMASNNVEALATIYKMC